ncbi:hypothetical protein K8I28_04115 [bacterium]|nr:hypothetical protein [bacterium]
MNPLITAILIEDIPDRDGHATKTAILLSQSGIRHHVELASRPWVIITILPMIHISAFRRLAYIMLA